MRSKGQDSSSTLLNLAMVGMAGISYTLVRLSTAIVPTGTDALGSRLFSVQGYDVFYNPEVDWRQAFLPKSNECYDGAVPQYLAEFTFAAIGLYIAFKIYKKITAKSASSDSAPGGPSVPPAWAGNPGQPPAAQV